VILAALGLTNTFWLALVLLTVWAMIFAADMPIRQAYLNDMIPSKQRATVLSFDSLMGSSGGVVIQPVLGKAADVYSYSTSLALGSLFQLVAVPFLLATRRENASADTAITVEPPAAALPPEPAAADQAPAELEATRTRG
jgi:MFS family permease